TGCACGRSCRSSRSRASAAARSSGTSRASISTKSAPRADDSSTSGRAAGGHLRAERRRSGNALGKAVADRWPGRDPASLGYAVRSRVPVVQIPPRGLWGKRGGPVLASGETWLGAPIGTDDAPVRLVCRYPAAFGPRTAADVQTWCWRTRLGPVLERLRPQLRTFRDEAGR